MKSVRDISGKSGQERFLRLPPLERMKAVYAVISEIIAIKAKAEGVTEYEIYRRYIKNNPRHYQKLLNLQN